MFPDRIDLGPGESAMVQVHVTRNGYCGPIDVEIGELSPGVHAEPASISWPETIASVHLTASDALSDEIRHVLVRTWTGHEEFFQFRLRTRSSTEVDWTADLLGIPHTRVFGDHVWIDESRFLFLDPQATALDEVTPIIRCIDPGVGPCADFGISGAVPLEPRSRTGSAQIALAPDGSVVVATGSWEPTPVITWGRLTPAGDWLPFPNLAAVATNTHVLDIAVDAVGRVLFLSKEFLPSAAARLVRLDPDGSLDASFGEAGSVSANAVGGIHLASDGRIILDGAQEFVWLQEDGTPTGTPVSFENYHHSAEVLPDGSMIYGQIIPAGEPHEKGSVSIVDSTGTVTSRWELGLGIKAKAFILGGDAPLVITQSVHGDYGRLRILRLPADDAPLAIADRQVGSSVPGRVSAKGSGLPVVIGGREFRLPDGGVGWKEVFVWRVE